MLNEPSRSMQVELFAASLRASYTDADAFLETLASKFSSALPSHTKVTRHAGLFSREHPVKEIAITLGDSQYRMRRERQGPLQVQRSHFVRGIILNTEDIPVEQWIEEVAAALARLAAESQLTNAALTRYLLQ
jgi:hypothetical protein